MKNEHRIALITVFFSAFVYISTIIYFAGKTYPFVGHDFEYFVPRLLDTYLHYNVNGLSIQWYTPSFGGGLPAYPNPQHMQFTLPALLMIWFDTWNAIWLSFAIFLLIGFVSSYFLFKDVFGFSPLASALGSSILNVNGFVFSHAIVGHLGYQAFPLLPLVILVLFQPKIRILHRSILLALVWAINIHSGGFYVIVMYILSLLIIVPILLILRPNLLDWKDLKRVLAPATLFAVLLSGSKLYATLSFMRWFPRALQDQYAVSLSDGLYGIFLQLFGTSTLVTFQALFANLTDLTDFMKAVNASYGGEYGIWEFDIGISPVALILCSVAPVLYILSKPHIKPTARVIVLLAISLFGVWLTTEFRLTDGFLYPYLRQLPILKSLHVNVRMAAAYILPLATLSAVGFHYLQTRLAAKTSLFAFVFFLLITCMPLVNYISFPENAYGFAFNIDQADNVYKTIKAGGTLPITSNERMESDFTAFQQQASNLTLYEPILGYQLEYFTPLVHPGNVDVIADNYFNITNPASLVFPTENNLEIFERIHVDEKDKFQQFIQHKQPAWNRPTIQKVLDVLMIFTLLILPILGLLPLKKQNSASNSAQT